MQASSASSLRRSCRKKGGITALKSFSFHIHSAPEENRRCDLCDLGKAAIEVKFIFHYLFHHVVQSVAETVCRVSGSDLCERWMQAAVQYVSRRVSECPPPPLGTVSVILEGFHWISVSGPCVLTPPVSWLALSRWSSVPPTAETLSWSSCFSWFDFLFALVCSSHSQGNTAGFQYNLQGNFCPWTRWPSGSSVNCVYLAAVSSIKLILSHSEAQHPFFRAPENHVSKSKYSFCSILESQPKTATFILKCQDCFGMVSSY